MTNRTPRTTRNTVARGSRRPSLGPGRLGRTRGYAAASAIAAMALVGAAPASADSFAYLKDGDVWLTTTDIARQFQVTDGGGYATVSQADDGTLLATTAGGRLRHLDRLGGVLSDIPTPVTQGMGNPAFLFFGPFDGDLSPDASTAAYGYTYQSFTSTHIDMATVTAFSRTDRLTGVTEAGYKQTKGWDSPEWIDDTHVLTSNGPGWPSDPFAVVTVGSGDAKGWFSDPDNHHPHDATRSRNGRVLAATNEDRTKLHVYRDEDGKTLGTVYPCFVYSDAQPVEYHSPTFNRDGSILAWADGRGLAVAHIGDTASMCPDGEDYVDVLPGASSPDWGPADVPPGRPVAAIPAQPTAGPIASGPGGAGASRPTPTPAPTAVVGAGGSGTNPATPPATVTPAPTPVPFAAPASLAVTPFTGRLRDARRSGMTVTVTAPRPGRLTVDASRGRTIVATGAVDATAAGPVRVTLTFTKRARRSLLQTRSVTLTAKAKQGTTVASGTLTLTR